MSNIDNVYDAINRYAGEMEHKQEEKYQSGYDDGISDSRIEYNYLVEALEKLEWLGENSDIDGNFIDKCCPACGATKKENQHHSKCFLWNALKKARGE